MTRQEIAKRNLDSIALRLDNLIDFYSVESSIHITLSDLFNLPIPLINQMAKHRRQKIERQERLRKQINQQQRTLMDRIKR